MTPFPLGPTGRIELPPEYRHTTALLKHQVRERADRPFLTIEGRTYTFGDVHGRVMRLATGLATVGVVEGSCIGTLLPNRAAFVVVWLASAHLGATIVAINPQFHGRLLDTALHDSQCSIVVVDASSREAMSTAAASTREQVAMVIDVDTEGNTDDGTIALRSLEAVFPSVMSEALGDLRSIHTISFTSGSTGPSKGVQVTTNQALDAACTYVHATSLGPEDTLYTPFAFFHGMSTRLGVLPALIVGAHVVVAERFSASRYWQEATDCGATVGQTLPTMTALLKARPAGPFDTTHRLTRMYNSRADDDFERRFHVRLVEAYGMTEIGLVVYTGFPERRAGAAGKVHPGWQMSIFDEYDDPVPKGEVGELVFRPNAPWLMTPGYIGRPTAMVEAISNLWFHTGDLGREDDDGYVYFIDRRKERIRRLGENISSFDVESLVSSHPDVRECAALGYPSAMGEDDVRIVVVPAEAGALNAESLYLWLEKVMPRYMLPRYIEFAASLPRTGTNKIEKFHLKAAGLAPDVWDREIRMSTGRVAGKSLA